MEGKESFAACKDLDTSLGNEWGGETKGQWTLGRNHQGRNAVQTQEKWRRKAIKLKEKSRNPQLTSSKRISSGVGPREKGRTLQGKHFDH